MKGNIKFYLPVLGSFLLLLLLFVATMRIVGKKK